MYKGYIVFYFGLYSIILHILEIEGKVAQNLIYNYTFFFSIAFWFTPTLKKNTMINLMIHRYLNPTSFTKYDEDY